MSLPIVRVQPTPSRLFQVSIIEQDYCNLVTILSGKVFLCRQVTLTVVEAGAVIIMARQAGAEHA